MYAFDTQMCSLPGPRAFWGTVCESIGLKLTVTPTAASETLRRENMETQRTWTRRLRVINHKVDAGWDQVGIRRLANSAAQTAVQWLDTELRDPNGAYCLDRQESADVGDRLGRIDEKLPDRFFDFETGNGIRDRNIVAEAFAGNYDLLVSNNIRSIDVIGLSAWLVEEADKALAIETRILTPGNTVEWIRDQHQMPSDWLAHIVARSSVTDSSDVDGSAYEMGVLIESLSKRGIDDIQTHVRLLLDDDRTFRRALEAVEREGRSHAARSESRRHTRVLDQLSRETGLDRGALDLSR